MTHFKKGDILVAIANRTPVTNSKNEWMGRVIEVFEHRDNGKIRCKTVHGNGGMRIGRIIRVEDDVSLYRLATKEEAFQIKLNLMSGDK